jgi:hypothetical protein
MKTQTCGPELDVLDETFVAEMGCPWMKNGWSEISVLDEKYTCGAGYRMFRMNFFGA